MTPNYAIKRTDVARTVAAALPPTLRLTVPLPIDLPADGGCRQATHPMSEAADHEHEQLHSFFEAWGGSQRISLAVARRGGGQTYYKTYVFEHPFVLIGSSEDSDLVLAEQDVCHR